MFTLNSLSEICGLHGTYASFQEDRPLLTPRTIEFLDGQDTLLSGVAYIAVEADAVAFFQQCQPLIFSGVLLFLSDAAETMPVLPEQLLVSGWRESAGRLFNKLHGLISGNDQDTFSRFSALWDDITQQGMQTSAEVLDRLHEIPGLTGPFVQVASVLFRPEKGVSVPYRLVLEKLLAFFPHSCGAVKENELILLITYENRRFDYPFDFEQISVILREYNGYMGISNGTRDLSSLRILYEMMRRSIRIGVILGVAAETRIVTMDRIGIFTVIDICARGFQMITGTESYLHLGHPAIVALRRYDVEHNDNLMEVLYFYLSFDCSISKTSERLHMHRNTVTNKIERICSNYKLNLEDRHLRQRLLFTCQLMCYYDTMGTHPSIPDWASPHIPGTAPKD